jgi:hypothetical protein
MGTRLVKVPIVCRGGPFDGDVFELEAPYPLVPDSSLDLPGWFTRDREPKIAGQGYYQVDSPTEMIWVEEPRTP